jgi:16S rRNA G1207 methylase RsmC
LEVAMATENKEQVLVAMEGEISNFERLIELAKECGFKILLAAMPRNLKRAEAELAEILALASVDGEMRERLAADYGRPKRRQ